jgi:hypothetical protein
MLTIFCMQSYVHSCIPQRRSATSSASFSASECSALHCIRFGFTLLKFVLDLHFMKSVRSEVLTAVLVKSEAFRGIMLCHVNS